MVSACLIIRCWDLEPRSPGESFRYSHSRRTRGVYYPWFVKELRGVVGTISSLVLLGFSNESFSVSAENLSLGGYCNGTELGDWVYLNCNVTKGSYPHGASVLTTDIHFWNALLHIRSVTMGSRYISRCWGMWMSARMSAHTDESAWTFCEPLNAN